MDPFDPIPNRPQSLDFDDLRPVPCYVQANQDVVLHSDGFSDLYDLFWPWAGETYASHIRVQISDPQDESFMPLVTQFHPGYQETIYGSEGMIITKRLMAPLLTNYDRSVLWVLECQAEGDRLLRIDVEIDWGEPLTQRVVDGLLVAQFNPGSARGIYAQRNAESTRVFGNPHGRPTSVDIEDARHAHLVYYVLVNGMAEVPLVMTISDVGEQVAWNGFLALRDSERVFELSSKAWGSALAASSVWTPDPRVNRIMRAARSAAISNTQRLRAGLAPRDRDVRHVPLLVDSFDLFDRGVSHNLLAHLRRVAERSSGQLPIYLPAHPKGPLEAPGTVLVETDGAYLRALRAHMLRGDEADLLADHYDAVYACAEALVLDRHQPQSSSSSGDDFAVGEVLQIAAFLAHRHGDEVNAFRWQSEAEQCGVASSDVQWQAADAGHTWQLPSTWQLCGNGLWQFADVWQGIEWATRLIWQGCGLSWRRAALHVRPTLPRQWAWWALMDVPHAGGSVSLVWDGSTLHATEPVTGPLPVRVEQQIRVRHIDEYDFDPQFEFSSLDGNGGEDGRSSVFRPTFLTMP